MSFTNSDALRFFKKLSSDSPTKDATKYAANNDMSQIDADFLSGVLAWTKSEGCRLLDLGSGGGLILDKIKVPIEFITAVEPFREFSSHIAPRPNMEIVNETMQDFTPDSMYDVISMFGIMQYFSTEEAGEIYRKYCKWLHHGGAMIVKNQFGVDGDVTIAGHSEQIGRDYFSQYRTVEQETGLLRSVGFENVQIFDIYPAECNHWNNTHYYALLAQKD